MPRKLRNWELEGGVMRYGRSASYHRSGKWAVKNRKTAADAAAAKPKRTTTSKQFQKGTRDVVRPKDPRHYTVERAQRRLKRRFTPKAARLRASIAPGTVLILLASRHRGKRVVFLKQLESGLLLVTGPYAVNGVPLRRVNQAFVIATSTSVDVAGVNLDKFDDKYFKESAAAGKEEHDKKEGDAADDERKYVLVKARKDDQKAVDAALGKKIDAVPQLRKYLGAKFTLTNGQHPHTMRF